MFAKSSKSEFGQREHCFLGNCLSQASVLVDPRKVQSILEWATPTSCTEVLRFTGLANYYRRFVEGYTEVCLGLAIRGYIGEGISCSFLKTILIRKPHPPSLPNPSLCP